MKEAFSAERVRRLFCKRTAQGLLFLVIRSLKKQKVVTHEELSEIVSQVFLGVKKIYEDIEFSGQIESLSFREVKLRNCKFGNVVFRNCEFDDGSSFERCEFRGDFAVYTCEEFEFSVLLAGDLSPQARAVFASRSVKGSDRRVSEGDVELVLNSIFSQLQNPDLSYRDMNKEGLISRVQKKNSYIADTVVNTLLHHGILEEKRGSLKHRVRIKLGNPEDVIAFHREGAVIRSMRDAMNDIMRKFN